MNSNQSRNLTVRFWGARGSIPSPALENMRYGGNTSCVELRCGDQILILDAGSGLRPLGRALVERANGGPIKATLLLSHTHWDHIQGLPFFAPGYSAENRIRILGHHGWNLRLQNALVNQMSPAHFPVGLEQMRGLRAVEALAPGTTELDGFLIQTTELNHPGGCAGFRIETGAAALGYLPDHEPYRIENRQGEPVMRLHHELVEFIRGLDVLILDTQYTAAEYTGRVGWGHGCLPDSVQLAMEAGVRRLIMFHHDPSHGDEQIDQMLATARALVLGSGLAVDAATENETISLGDSGAVQAGSGAAGEIAEGPKGQDFVPRVPSRALGLL